jgi:hypothetical protein
MPHESTFELAFWECGHVEVDRGKTHPCDGRDVCSATYRRVVLADDVRRWLHGRQATVAAFEADFGR